MKKRSRQKNVAVAEDSSIADLFSCKLGDDVDHFSLPISWTAVDTNKVYRKLENNLYKMFPRRQVDKDESTAPCQCVDSCDSQCQNRQLFMECDPAVCPTLNQCNKSKSYRGTHNKKESNETILYCSNCVLQSKQFPSLQVFTTRFCGFGLRILTDVAAHSILCEYLGEVITASETLTRMKNYVSSDDFYFASLGNGLLLDAAKVGSIARFANHSCAPNCTLQKWIVAGAPRIALVSLRPIHNGEELTYNYHYYDDGMDDVIVKRQPCGCGASNCSGTIGGRVQKAEATPINLWFDRSTSMVQTFHIRKKKFTIFQLESHLLSLLEIEEEEKIVWEQQQQRKNKRNRRTYDYTRDTEVEAIWQQLFNIFNGNIEVYNEVILAIGKSKRKAWDILSVCSRVEDKSDVKMVSETENLNGVPLLEQKSSNPNRHGKVQFLSIMDRATTSVLKYEDVGTMQQILKKISKIEAIVLQCTQYGLQVQSMTNTTAQDTDTSPPTWPDVLFAFKELSSLSGHIDICSFFTASDTCGNTHVTVQKEGEDNSLVTHAPAELESLIYFYSVYSEWCRIWFSDVVTLWGDASTASIGKENNLSLASSVLTESDSYIERVQKVSSWNHVQNVFVVLSRQEKRGSHFEYWISQDLHPWPFLVECWWSDKLSNYIQRQNMLRSLHANSKSLFNLENVNVRLADSAALESSKHKCKSTTGIADDRALDEDNTLHCFCQLPECDSEIPVMVQCDACNNWYHPQCINQNKTASRLAGKKKVFYCPCCLMMRGMPGVFAYKACSTWSSHFYHTVKDPSNDEKKSKMCVKGDGGPSKSEHRGRKKGDAKKCVSDKAEHEKCETVGCAETAVVIKQEGEVVDTVLADFSVVPLMSANVTANTVLKSSMSVDELMVTKAPTVQSLDGADDKYLDDANAVIPDCCADGDPTDINIPSSLPPPDQQYWSPGGINSRRSGFLNNPTAARHTLFSSCELKEVTGSSMDLPIKQTPVSLLLNLCLGYVYTWRDNVNALLNLMDDKEVTESLFAGFEFNSITNACSRQESELLWIKWLKQVCFLSFSLRLLRVNVSPELRLLRRRMWVLSVLPLLPYTSDEGDESADLCNEDAAIPMDHCDVTGSDNVNADISPLRCTHIVQYKVPVHDAAIPISVASRVTTNDVKLIVDTGKALGCGDFNSVVWSGVFNHLKCQYNEVVQLLDWSLIEKCPLVAVNVCNKWSELLTNVWGGRLDMLQEYGYVRIHCIAYVPGSAGAQPSSAAVPAEAAVTVSEEVSVPMEVTEPSCCTVVNGESTVGMVIVQEHMEVLTPIASEAVTSDDVEALPPADVYCWCRRPDDGRRMVGCDSCSEWFHVNCVNYNNKSKRHSSDGDDVDVYICISCSEQQGLQFANKW